ncbi:hypothetical protein GIW70_21645 [Pseudomonas syringae]|nr:hypothetical protein [Pseudomonas syringae]MCF5070789.1 hypothetical protein [Pseudomonas syringae]
MRMSDFLVRELGRRQVALFFLLATTLFVLPIIFADFPYIDDNWRALAAGNSWAGQGRLFADWFYQALTFTGGAPNIFPLPLLLVTGIISLALTRLTFHYFPEPTLACCLVVLPLWYNPFLLQNLSYQYDGPSMALSLVAVVYAMTFCGSGRVQRWVVPALLIALALGLYQISLNVFLGLSCVEVVRAVERRLSWTVVGRMLGLKLAQLALGIFIYGITAYPYMQPQRQALLDWTAEPLLQISINIGRVLEKTTLLFHGGYAGVSAVLMLCALIGGAKLGRSNTGRWKSFVPGLICLLALGTLVLLVPGMSLFFRDFNEGARTLMGFGVLLVLLFYLAFFALASMHRRMPLLLAIPLLAMLSLSFAYGRVLSMQKTIADNALFSLSHDISAYRELREAKRIYLAVTYSDHWLTSAAGSFQRLPVLRYLLNVDYFMLAENLPAAGITNVVAERERRNATHVGYQGFPPLLETQYYRIYLIGDYGFIVMKEPPRNRILRW